MDDLKQFIKDTFLDTVEESELYQKAKELTESIQALHDTVPTRYNSWFDQVTRSSQSILLNVCEAHGKGRGYYLSALMIGRGEAYETYGALAIGPQQFSHLKPLAKNVCNLVSEKVLAIL